MEDRTYDTVTYELADITTRFFAIVIDGIILGIIGGLLFATPTTLLVVPYLFARLRKGNDGKRDHGVFDEVLE